MHRLFFIITFAPLVLSTVVYAATPFTIEDVGSSVGLGTSDLKNTTVNVISWVLGIMALVAVAMIIFSGFIAATSGDEERVERAKKTIMGAVIGLIVILLAWAIVIFVAGTTRNVAS